VLAGLGTGEQARADTERERASGEIRLSVADATASAEAVRLLDSRQLPIAAIELQEPSLDDVFLALTGRPAENEAPVQEAA
jgi:hypothetical protein